jgi:hypothetical protein
MKAAFATAIPNPAHARLQAPLDGTPSHAHARAMGEANVPVIVASDFNVVPTELQLPRMRGQRDPP